jgi:hypothetical protein
LTYADAVHKPVTANKDSTNSKGAERNELGPPEALEEGHSAL